MSSRRELKTTIPDNVRAYIMWLVQERLAKRNELHLRELRDVHADYRERIARLESEIERLKARLTDPPDPEQTDAPTPRPAPDAPSSSGSQTSD